ncbi:MAG: hypothetical protein IJT98_00635 [Prevotella sp.]|nr:hypothetical protein [Prevotella sp.]
MPYLNLTPQEMADEMGRLARLLHQQDRTDLLLQAIGVSMLEDLRLEAAKVKLQPLRITEDCRFFVGQREVELQPVHKAVYLLFLAHPEGIEFKRLGEYREELTEYYTRTARLLDKERIAEGVNHLVDPLDNAINEKCSRIKSVFSAMMDEYTASYYIISSRAKKHIAGSSRIWYERLKVITLPRELVVSDWYRDRRF